ncbi:unnamed protein product [Phytomonas sp. EM1]|nr:unnamed protein product [Phytomonas sp. EM1]|eukprot:CCW60497.1 unnamed protein product [Phytomonas sp. isolate EM1]
MNLLDSETPEPRKSTLTSELTKLRKEIAEEESKLGVLEDAVETYSANLTCLHNEYASNVSHVVSFYEIQLRPFQQVVYAADEQQSLIQMQIDWLEKKIVLQEKCTREGQFLEARDMRPAAEALLKHARQQLLRSYAAIQECPKKDLITMRNYECPPDESIETMRMVMRLRGEENFSWTASQVYMTENYFTGFFIARSETLLKTFDLLPEDRMLALEAFCRNPAHDVRALFRLSTPIGCLGQWLRAIRDHYRVKLVTAPVLLTDTSLQHTEEVREFLAYCTFGAQKDQFTAEETEVPPTAGASEELPTEAVADGVGGEPAADAEENPAKQRLERQAREMMEAYRGTKKRLAQFTQPVVVNQVAVRKLRHHLNFIKENSREARESMETIEREAMGKLAELRKKYDGTMVPLEGKLEKKVGDFVKVLHGEPLENSCS